MKSTFKSMVAGIFACSLVATSAIAQTKPLEQREVGLAIDSGHVFPTANERGVIYSTLVQLDDAPWVRLKFAEATLGQSPKGGQPTLIKITSNQDGAFQTMRAEHLIQWSNTCAYFNGNSVLVEIIADPGAAASRLVIDGAWIGLPPEPVNDDERTICFGTDDRVLSNEAANGRLMTVGCTAWLISDSANCFLTAGHCTTTSTSVVQFNVPLSNTNGTVNHPPPQHQYAVDLNSVQTSGSGGVGNDWKYFGCHPNSVTGLTPYQAQGAAYNLASTAPAVSGQQIRITGYGTVSSPVTPTWNQVQKTHSGPYASQTGNAVTYQTDTTGGNSGSPVFDLSTGLCIGIHTHGGCTSTGGANQGTAIHHPNLQTALANPTGVCFAQGFNLQVDPNNQSICAPANAMYTVNVGQVGTQTAPVTLNVNNLPAGATVQFSVNPVQPGNPSVMTISNTGNIAVGTHQFQVIGNNGTFQHQAQVSLGVSNSTPGVAALISPANGAVDQSLVPMLSWSAASQAQNYLVQIAQDAGFSSIVYSANTSSTSHEVTVALQPTTNYFWRVRPDNLCGQGAFSSVFSFTTRAIPAILVVDDDDNAPDVRAYYTAALNSLGLQYDIWDTANTSQNEPTLAQISPYSVIIWFSGDSFGGTGAPKAGPKAATEVVLQQWLEAGGCLFLSAQDYMWDRLGSGNTTTNAFMQQYLGMASPIAHDQNYTAINAGLNVFVGQGPWTLTYTAASGGPGVSNFSDRVQPTAGGLQAFTFGPSSFGAAVTRDGGLYRTSFWAFPFESIPTAAQRSGAMNKFVQWCGKLDTPCAGDVSGDDVVNVADLLAVISAWGPCGNPQDCPPDLNNDDQVNVADLLLVISNWGNCP